MKDIGLQTDWTLVKYKQDIGLQKSKTQQASQTNTTAPLLPHAPFKVFWLYNQPCTTKHKHTHVFLHWLCYFPLGFNEYKRKGGLFPVCLFHFCLLSFAFNLSFSALRDWSKSSTAIIPLMKYCSQYAKSKGQKLEKNVWTGMTVQIWTGVQTLRIAAVDQKLSGSKSY